MQVQFYVRDITDPMSEWVCAPVGSNIELGTITPTNRGFEVRGYPNAIPLMAASFTEATEELKIILAKLRYRIH